MLYRELGPWQERALFTPFTLHSVDVPVVDRDACSKNYTAHGAKISERMICAGGTGDGKDSCQVGLPAMEPQPWVSFKDLG